MMVASILKYQDRILYGITGNENRVHVSFLYAITCCRFANFKSESTNENILDIWITKSRRFP